MMKTLEVFLVFLRLGCTSFGGPIAHLGFFQNEFVQKRKWLQQQAYADLAALCQLLPGPASSQVGMAIGFSRAGHLGAIVAWLGFTAPSAILMTLIAIGISGINDPRYSGFLHGLKIVAVAIVAQAIISMAKKLCPDFTRIVIAISAALCTALLTTHFNQIITIVAAGVIGIIIFRKSDATFDTTIKRSPSKKIGAILVSFFLLLLILLPLVAEQTKRTEIQLFDKFFRAGALVFGGGHVVLPLLKSEVVTTGLISSESFMAGYGAAQAIPGPLFSFAAYLGAAIGASTGSSLQIALLCLLAIFLPSYLLIIGILPFWQHLQKNKKINSAIKAINAAVVGLLIAAFCSPVWTSAIFDIKDFAIALAAFIALYFLNLPSWLVVIAGSTAAGILSFTW